MSLKQREVRITGRKGKEVAENWKSSMFNLRTFFVSILNTLMEYWRNLLFNLVTLVHLLSTMSRPKPDLPLGHQDNHFVQYS